MEFTTNKELALELDRNDPLAKFRDEFDLPLDQHGKPSTYLCGNSLGPMPKKAEREIKLVLDQWKTLGVQGHFEGDRPWIAYHDNLVLPMAAILGAREDEVTFMGTLTGNIHLMLASFYKPQAFRQKILTIGGDFPSDRYALQSMLALRGLSAEEIILTIEPTSGEHLIQRTEIERLIGRHANELALVYLPALQFTTGQALDLQMITNLAHNHGISVGFDLAHAAGNIPLELHHWNVDFAVWCGYKYLCSGPGNGAGIFVHQKYVSNPDFAHLAGWWGNDPDTRFEMRQAFEPLLTAQRFQLSNPSILSLAPVAAALDLFISAGLEQIWRKSRLMTAYLEFLVNAFVGNRVEIITPTEPNQRGCQISIAVPGNAKQLTHLLDQRGCIVDERPPNLIRIAPHPLYNRYHEVWQFVQILNEIT